MKKDNTLNALKQTFKKSVPEQDKRTGLSHLQFVSGFIFCFIGDTKASSLEAMRRFMMNTFDARISKGAFWERLSRHKFKTMLHAILANLIKNIPAIAVAGNEILDKLQVATILLIDSSSLTLWDGAQDTYPGTRTTAGIKWHACFNLLSGKMEWFSVSSTSVHDRKCFPNVSWLKGKLIIFDLGYWDYELFAAIDLAGGFFLSRVKSNAVISMSKMVKGISSQRVGEKLSSINLKQKRRNIIEFIGKIGSGKDAKCYRVIGFWNATDKKYHWYVTNLKVTALVIYTLYRIRWQIELIFKGCKSSLNLDGKMTSNNDNIIEALVLSSIIASFAMCLVFNEGAKWLTKQEKTSISFQRLSHVVVLLSQDFIRFLTLDHHIEKLKKKIKLLSCEIFEKNHHHRPTTLQRLTDELACN